MDLFLTIHQSYPLNGFKMDDFNAASIQFHVHFEKIHSGGEYIPNINCQL